ncbi:hypothetical protein J8I87_23645 [Paraburkholderia sp. LEh10]|uniref:hypothetical protein n=1 Tax=Paraburkholderia sp. LEh10 TaxID=2821353 RepID=UPI001AE5C27D|nr:hypothetical protein [Paraburkholderia sp. LEh10]MBP0592673.1 hypothetical protein [Paraburkholderia sp. LEh10]
MPASLAILSISITIPLLIEHQPNRPHAARGETPIVGRYESGGKTRHDPSPCRKKKIARDPGDKNGSARTHRIDPFDAQRSRVTRIGAVALGASHLSITLRKETTSLLISRSFRSVPENLKP